MSNRDQSSQWDRSTRLGFSLSPMHNHAVSPENTNGRVRCGNFIKHTPTNPGDTKTRWFPMIPTGQNSEILKVCCQVYRKYVNEYHVSLLNIFVGIRNPRKKPSMRFKNRNLLEFLRLNNIVQTQVWVIFLLSWIDDEFTLYSISRTDLKWVVLSQRVDESTLGQLYSTPTLTYIVFILCFDATYSHSRGRATLNYD